MNSSSCCSDVHSKLIDESKKQKEKKMLFQDQMDMFFEIEGIESDMKKVWATLLSGNTGKNLRSLDDDLQKQQLQEAKVNDLHRQLDNLNGWAKSHKTINPELKRRLYVLNEDFNRLLGESKKRTEDMILAWRFHQHSPEELQLVISEQKSTNDMVRAMKSLFR